MTLSVVQATSLILEVPWPAAHPAGRVTAVGLLPPCCHALAAPQETPVPVGAVVVHVGTRFSVALVNAVIEVMQLSPSPRLPPRKCV